jgi:putative oxidoreductase
MNKLINVYNTIFGAANYLAIPALLGARLYVAWVFFKSGLTKLNNWESTLELFEYEYVVPVLDSVSAAYLATVGELVLPVLLALGLFSRKAALGLFIVNYVAVISL